MRLIDADKIEYMWQQDINGNFHDGVTLESIVGKTPTENVNDLIAKELENIKAEIMGIGNWREHYEMPIAYLSCLVIVEYHISKLKGETE